MKKSVLLLVYAVILTACTKNAPAGHEFNWGKFVLLVILLLILFTIYRMPLIMSELKSNIITGKTPFLVIFIKLWKYKKTQKQQKITVNKQKDMNETELLIKTRYNSDVRIESTQKFPSFSFGKNFTSWNEGTKFPNVDYLFEQVLIQELKEEKTEENKIATLRRFFPKNSLDKNYSGFNYFESFKDPQDLACTASEIMKHFLAIDGLRGKYNLYLWKDTSSKKPKTIYKIVNISRSPLKDKWNLVVYPYNNFRHRSDRENTQIVVKI